jgi:hypothetical protein
MTPARVAAWSLRLLVVAGIVLLCRLAHTGIPAVAFALAWVPNYPFLGAAMTGALRLPRCLVPVHAVEAAVYGWLGIGAVKRLVTSRGWLLLVGLEPPQKSPDHLTLLQRTDQLTQGAEVCHGASFVFATGMAVFCLAIGGHVATLWIVIFNIALNGYPIMLQRSTRWRVQTIRATHRGIHVSG